MTMLRRLLTFAFVMLVAAGFAWALWPRPMEVETATIGRRTIEIAVEEEGKTRIVDVFTVSSPLAGRMARINLHPGDPVIANDTVIAQIRATAPSLLDSRARRVAEAAIDAALAGVDLASAQLNQAQAQNEFLASEFERAEKLVKTGAMPERGLEKARLDLASAQAAVESGRANLVVRQRELERARAAVIEPGESEPGETENNEGCCVPVKSPVSGQVLRLLTESEQVVQPGTPIAELGDAGDLEIVADLLSRDAVRVRPGAKAVIEGWGGGPLQAEVKRVDPAAFTKVSALGIEEQRVSVVLTPLGDKQAWKQLGHEFRVIARIAISSTRDVVAVPIGALFRSGGDWAVYTVQDGRAASVKLEIGERNADYAQVLSGLEPGQTVILHPSDQITQGTRVIGKGMGKGTAPT
jgi:HlyD family secretion protein